MEVSTVIATIIVGAFITIFSIILALVILRLQRRTPSPSYGSYELEYMSDDHIESPMKPMSDSDNTESNVDDHFTELKERELS